MQTQQALPRTSRPAPDRLLPHGSARLPCRRRCAAFVACSVSGDQQCNAGQQQRTGQRHQQQRQQRLEQQNGMHALATAAIAGALWLSAPQYASARDAIDASSPLYDGAKVIAAERRLELTQQLQDLESTTGWKVRVYTSFDQTIQPRAAWGVDSKTVLLGVDPSSPNIFRLDYIGDEVFDKLRRPWWLELQSRYGNLFNVRDQGESASIQAAIGAITQCLTAPEGCQVVPGLPEEQLTLCLGFAAAGGLIAGFVAKIPAQGFIKRQWLWLLIFSPLWAPLIINFGLGPVVSRTSELGPIAAVLGSAVAAAGAVQVPALLMKQGS